MTATIPAAAVIAANPGPAAHLAALGVVLLVGLTLYGVVRLRRRREIAEAQREPDRPEASSASRRSETPGP